MGQPGRTGTGPGRYGTWPIETRPGRGLATWTKILDESLSESTLPLFLKRRMRVLLCFMSQSLGSIKACFFWLVAIQFQNG